jgi:hypothetical protein
MATVGDAYWGLSVSALVTRAGGHMHARKGKLFSINGAPLAKARDKGGVTSVGLLMRALNACAVPVVSSQR